MKILIADDDLVMLELLGETVTALGHRVVKVTDGAAALEVLESPEPPGLALLDWVMPKLNGLEICQALRRPGERGPETYLILVTARTRKMDVVEGLRAGAHDYVTKPFNPDELAARIEIGIRTSCLERRLRSKVREMDSLQARLRSAEGLLSCPDCLRANGSPDWLRAVDEHRQQHGHSSAPCPACIPATCST